MPKSTMFKVQTPYGEFKRESQSKAYQFAVVCCGKTEASIRRFANAEIARTEKALAHERIELAAAIANGGVSPDRQRHVYGSTYVTDKGFPAAQWQAWVDNSEQRLITLAQQADEDVRDSEIAQREHRGFAYGWSQSASGAVAMAKKATSDGWIVVGLAPVDGDPNQYVPGYAMLTGRTMLASERTRVAQVHA